MIFKEYVIAIALVIWTLLISLPGIFIAIGIASQERKDKKCLND